MLPVDLNAYSNSTSFTAKLELKARYSDNDAYSIPKKVTLGILGQINKEEK
jgi:hypothetical protein